MTGQEARTKWCPFTRVVMASESGIVDVAVAANRSSRRGGNNDIATGSQCIASDCMAWRWAGDGDALSASGQGFCGLAGRPS